jgi:hypothetical protein
VDAQLAAQLKKLRLPLSGNIAASPLFNGTLFFARIQFTIQNQSNTVIAVSGSDTATAVNCATQAVVPIS